MRCSHSKKIMPRINSIPLRRNMRRRLYVRLLHLLKLTSSQRRRRLKRVQQSVRADIYENELKLQIALDRMLQDLGD